MDGSGGTYLDAMRGMGARDVALVFTCQPYPREILRALEFACERRAKLVTITDGPLSPAARSASVVFNVRPTGSSLLSLRRALDARAPTVIEVEVSLEVKGYRSVWYPYPANFYQTWTPGPLPS